MLAGRRLLAAEPPQPQDLVIMILGLHMRPAHATVWSGGLVRLLEQLGFSQGAARVALARLVRRGLLRRVHRGRRVSYALTARARHVLDEGDRRILGLGQSIAAPRLFTTLIHQLPDDRRLERQRLARRLRFLGFGSLQDGLWISPRDRSGELAELLAELRIERYVTLLVGRRLPVATYPLFERAWDLPALAARYRLFAEEFAPFARAAGRRGLDDAEAFALRTVMMHLFRGFAFLEPELPDGLMPDAGARRRALAVFRAVHGRLAVAAQRHFDAAMRP